MFEYLIILLTLFLITFILEKVYHIHLYKSKRERAEIVGIFFIIGIIWDSFAISRGHWIFPPENNLGIIIGVMPLEEYLFILIIPYFVITLYRLIDSKFKKTSKK
ncbi:lycopene cyclase domain-containing protein [Candidatus Woesearchaeota archaeon]|nr:lycopene cyclase domain-containing protein [Candidatus Woesearchaeota archaeon]